MTIGEKIKERREAMNLSQKQLAKRAGLTNVSVCSIENDSTCNIQSLTKLCEALNMRIELVNTDNGANHITLDTANLDYDIKYCCRQLDKVKKTLQELTK